MGNWASSQDDIATGDPKKDKLIKKFFKAT